MTISEREVVAALGQRLSQRIEEQRYNLWFANKTKFTWEDDEIIVGVPNLHFQEWLQKTFLEDVRACASEVFGKLMQVRFTIDPELFQAARKAQLELGTGPSTRPSVVGEDDLEPENDSQAAACSISASNSQRKSTNTRRWRTLAEFVVGPSNRVAHASALSIVEGGGHGVNPLVVHGPVGTGKTHLLEGIYAGLRRKQQEWRVCYVTSEDFTNRFVQAMRLNKLAGFRGFFRECDALLFDDLNFLASKPATQEEFLHTFDTLHANGKQMVLTCDCHPRLADDLSPELSDRLLGGAIWSLMPPDQETRLAILRSKCIPGEAPVDEKVLGLLAENLRGNVREMEGALHSLRHFARVTGKKLDLAAAREALGDLLRHSIRLVRIEDVEAAVCKVLRLDRGTLKSKNRAWSVSHPRMVAMFLARKHTTAAYSEIGNHFGNLNHSSVVAAEKKVRRWIQDNDDLVLGERHLKIREVLELAERELNQ